MTVETINKLVHTMSLLEMNFEIVDLTASMGHPSKRMKISQLGVEMLDNLKTAELIYDQALSLFNSSSSKPDTDWKLVFYVVEAGRRGYLHLLK